jgi:hypothetical protein
LLPPRDEACDPIFVHTVPKLSVGAEESAVPCKVVINVNTFPEVTLEAVVTEFPNHAEVVCTITGAAYDGGAVLI